MDAMEAILSRRSIRKFGSASINETDIHELLDAAMSAPSSSNGQPWHFIVITDRKTLDEIPQFHPYSNMIKEAPLAFIICGDLNLEKGRGVWVQDCSAATENILIATNAKGLGAVWLGVYPIEEYAVYLVYQPKSCHCVLLLLDIQPKRNHQQIVSIQIESIEINGDSLLI